jgi:hypothetical protein
MNFRGEIDGVKYYCKYNSFYRGVVLTVKYGFMKIKRILSFEIISYIDIDEVINLELEDMKREVMKYYEIFK